jgi:DNA helicase-2/ATP-dependent DNA helicase PcrA
MGRDSRSWPHPLSACSFQQALIWQGVKAVIAQRRDRFISPQFTWLQACLDQALHANDLTKQSGAVANNLAFIEYDFAFVDADHGRSRH